MEYQFCLEKFEDNYPELERLYRMHYAEMQSRLKSDGIDIPEYNPRLMDYVNYSRAGQLLTWVIRLDGKAVGYSNIYLVHDMHNQELIAEEDTIFVEPEHRNGVGRRLVKEILKHLSALGVKRVIISPVTDLRVEKIWARMGFKTYSSLMVYTY